MKYKYKKSGFSLTEVLLAIGVLTVGMIFIAGVFPVAIHFTTIATERTTAAVVADEAFAKVRLYAVGDPNTINDNIDPNELKTNELKDFNDSDIFPATADVDADVFAYPSDPNIDVSKKQYFWSALCRLTEEYDATSNPNPLVQVTVFVSRRTSPNLNYYNKNSDGEVSWPTPAEIDWPLPVKVEVEQPGGLGNNELRIKKSNEKSFINDGYTIVDDETGEIYRVLERYAATPADTILLDRKWNPDITPDYVWVVPPPVNGGRYPCIAVYQKLIRF